MTKKADHRLFVDAYRDELKKYALAGLKRVAKDGSKSFRVDWNDWPFFCRAYDLTSYGDDEAGEYEDRLPLPDFPSDKIKKFIDQAADKNLASTFVNPLNADGSLCDIREDEDKWWSSSFDSGEGNEAAEWICLMIDDVIIKMEAEFQKRNKKMEIEFCGHDGQYPRGMKSYRDNIKEIRKKRKYQVSPDMVTSFLRLFAKTLDPKWFKGLKK